MDTNTLMQDIFNNLGKVEKTNFIEIDITDDILKIANFKAQDMGHINKSIMKGEGNLAGFLGEECVKKYFGLQLGTEENTYDYDLIYLGEKIDVKSKRTSVIPRCNHECSVAALNTRQNCDYYIFTRVLFEDESPKKVYIMGYARKSDYYNRARFLRKGEVDGSNRFIVREDCYNMYYSDLSSVERLKK